MEALPSNNLQESPKQSNLVFGVIAACIVGLIGMVAWFFLVKLTGYEIGIVAWALGALIGWVAVTVTREASPGLGIACGICACLSILGGQLLIVVDVMKEYADYGTESAYDDYMAYAVEAVQATTDDQIRVVLAKHWSYEDEVYQPADITAEDITYLREQLPSLHAFINGTPTREEFEAEYLFDYTSPEQIGYIYLSSFSLFTLLWLFLGVGSAWKIGAMRSMD
jgi:hypothetical protein